MRSHRVFDRGGALGVDREGLLDDDVDAGLERADDERRVQVVAGGDDDAVDALGADELFEPVGVPGRRRGDAGVDRALHREGGTDGIRFADRDELGVVGVLAGDRIDVHLRTAAGSDDGVTAPAHRTPLAGETLSNWQFTVAQALPREEGILTSPIATPSPWAAWVRSREVRRFAGQAGQPVTSMESWPRKRFPIRWT